MNPRNPRSTTGRRETPLGEILIEAGVIDSGDLERALAYRAENGGRLGQALIAMGLIDEDMLAQALSSQGKILCMELHPEIVDRGVAKRLGLDFSRQQMAIAVNQIGDITTVAMTDPSDILTLDEIGRLLGTKTLGVWAQVGQISFCIEAVFQTVVDEDAALDQLMESTSLDTLGIELREVGSDDVEEEQLETSGGTGTSPVIDMVRRIFHAAFEAGASDIHLEPRTDSVQVRFRIDGMLHDRLALPKKWARPLLARIKILANLDIAQRRLPQDGRAQGEFNGQRVDLRVATAPTLLGEGGVVRILDGGRDLKGLGHLGLTSTQLDRIYSMVESKEGFLLATGPTGSGKTTTLYSLLQYLHSPERKIITLEDPVENQLDGITQINTHAKIGLTFSAGLRSILRQDPDVVLLGEIRDRETAEIAVQASMTGHLVLSTLHTTGSVESIMRLRDMGIEPYYILDTMRGIIAQRLVRRICDDCKEELEPDKRVRERLDLDPDRGPYYSGKGCDKCLGLGFRGRIGLYEILTLNEPVCEAMRREASSNELRAVACAGGMTTLREEGVRKALAGETSLREVLSICSRMDG